ncbi:MAG: DUF445 domain-containing protein [Microvirgula sp.]
MPMTTDTPPRHASWLGRHRGTVSLAVAVTGLVAGEAATRAGLLPPHAGRVLVTAFEGATVGGLADWFAVSALFRRIPIPLVARHTDLLARKRERLADGIVEMVETHWLSPAVVRERLAGVSFSGLIASYLRDPRNRDSVRRALRGFIVPLTAALEHPTVVEAIAAGARSRLATADLGRPLGQGLAQVLADPAIQHRLGDGLADVLGAALGKAELQAWFRDALLSALSEYAHEGWWESTKIRLARLFLDGDDDAGKVEHLVGEMAERLQLVLADVRADPAHPLRLGLYAALHRWATRMAAGETPSAAMLTAGLRELLDKALQPGGALTGWLSMLRHELDAALDDPASAASLRLDALIGGAIAHFLTHDDTRNGFDDIVRRLIVEVIESRPQLIGDTVRLSLSESRLPTRALVRQIEDKVGEELQWIRVNGAVVGGLAAAVIALTRMWLG